MHILAYSFENFLRFQVSKISITLLIITNYVLKNIILLLQIYKKSINKSIGLMAFFIKYILYV